MTNTTAGDADMVRQFLRDINNILPSRRLITECEVTRIVGSQSANTHIVQFKSLTTDHWGGITTDSADLYPVGERLFVEWDDEEYPVRVAKVLWEQR